MCKVKSGALIKNAEDVQNLVVGVINRQEERYCKEQILVMVRHYMRGSSLSLSNDYLKEIISVNLDILYRSNFVECRNGYYIPKNIFCMLNYRR